MMRKLFKSLFPTERRALATIPTAFPVYTKQAIRLIIASNGQLTDGQLLALFAENQIPASEAVELLLFLPVAFCRHLLPQIQWPAYYFEYRSAGKSSKKTYAANKRYEIMGAVLRAGIAGGFKQADYYKLAGRSASFHAINRMLLDDPRRKLAEVLVAPETVIY